MPSVTAHAPLRPSLQPSARPANPDPSGFGVYIHWPFCASKCPYCDFNSHVRSGGVDETRFLAAYLRELERHRETSGPRSVGSVFIGGGTPSLMAPATVGKIIDQIAALWSLEPHAEITLEANPSSVEAERFAGYRTAGVNRVSLGIQALDDASLRKLGRLHTADEARRALKIATQTFDRYSFDLIYARPGQTTAEWQAELSEAITMAGGHLSLYQLTIEDGTPFAQLHAVGRLVTPPPEAAADLYQLTQDLTGAADMPAYEISNHAAPGQESRHNLLYWRYGEYVGIGPGAHGRPIVNGRRTATSTQRNPEVWLSAIEMGSDGLIENAGLSAAEQVDEALLMGLRISEGLPVERLERLGGRRVNEDVLRCLRDDGLLETDTASEILRATATGRMVLDTVITILAPAVAPMP